MAIIDVINGDILLFDDDGNAIDTIRCDGVVDLAGKIEEVGCLDLDEKFGHPERMGGAACYISTDYCCRRRGMAVRIYEEMTRTKLLAAARRIAANRNERPASPLTALRKLFIQERRVWPSGERVGWKLGELCELAQAIVAGDWQAAAQEWGDVAYYVAQVGGVVWLLYSLVTPEEIISSACAKFERRANKGE